jgi:hypothetical protein
MLLVRDSKRVGLVGGESDGIYYDWMVARFALIGTS